MWTTKKKLIYIVYSVFAKWLPTSAHSSVCKGIRAYFGRHIMHKMGKHVNIEKGACFTPELQIGDYSGIGIRSEIYGPVVIGEYVMMGPEVVIYTRNHKHEMGVPFCQQGFEDYDPVIIGNNVWIGRRAMFMPGSAVGSNVIVAAGAVVTKKFGDNLVIGGVPAKIISKL